MPTFKVSLVQYVEEVATVEVEADSVEQAMELAIDEDIDWRDGDTSSGPEVWKVRDENDKVVWTQKDGGDV